MANLKGTQLSQKHDWETPQALFDTFDTTYCFMLDTCASAANTKCGRWYGPQGEHMDALDPDLVWPVEGALWMNPPYKRGVQDQFVKKAMETSLRGGCVVALLPSRTDTKMFHTYIWDTHVHRPHPWVQEILFLKGRVGFVGGAAKAPFPSMVVIFGRR